MNKANFTLEYTAPCAAFGEQEIILIHLSGREDEGGIIAKY